MKQESTKKHHFSLENITSNLETIQLENRLDTLLANWKHQEDNDVSNPIRLLQGQ